MKYFSIASMVASMAVLSALLGAATAVYDPILFENVLLYKGCNNGDYFGGCLNSAGIDVTGCIHWYFTQSPQPLKETCIYHSSGLNLTTCFIYSSSVLLQDANYLVEQVLWDDIFGLRGFRGVGIVSRAWATGYIWSKDKTYSTHYSVSIKQGQWETLHTTILVETGLPSSISPLTTYNATC